MKERTKGFAPQVVRLYASLPRSVIAQTFGKQVLRSGTSVGAHYREAVRSRSDAEYVSKIEGALQEIEETGYWLELLADAGVCQSGSLTALRAEADELTAMLVTCAKKAEEKNEE